LQSLLAADLEFHTLLVYMSVYKICINPCTAKRLKSTQTRTQHKIGFQINSSLKECILSHVTVLYQMLSRVTVLCDGFVK